MNDVEKGRARQQALFNFLDQYEAATTDQLARLFWGGNNRLARLHLLQYLRSDPGRLPRRLHRLPHPLYRNGAYVYTTRHKGTSHSQKVLHHLSLVDFHLATTSHIGRYGARIVPELPWGPGLIPDQTLVWKDSVWAIEHHLSGPFSHANDYREFMEEEGYNLCHWWRSGLRIGLLVLTAVNALEHVRRQLKLVDLQGLPWRVATMEEARTDVGGIVRSILPIRTLSQNRI